SQFTPIRLEAGRGGLDPTVGVLAPFHGAAYCVYARPPLIRKKLEAFIGDTALQSIRKQHEYFASVV
ncbi:MAG: hypothetical protein WBM48_17895, partial [Polyangiales bacterium]